MSQIVFTDDIKPKTINLKTESRKCPSCGATLKYSPALKKLTCEHCGTVKSINIRPQQEIAYTQDVFKEFDKKNVELIWSNNEIVSYKCSSCGAVSMMDRYETASVCPFCKAPQITKLDNVDSMKPNAIIPFAVPLDNALANAKKWLKGKFFANYKVKKNILMNNVCGVYVPLWTFDFVTVCHYQGVLGKRKTRTVRVGKTVRTEFYTEYFNVNGIMNCEYDDIVVEASSKIDSNELKNIGNFSTQNALAYNDDFLAGFSAQRYDRDIEQSMSEAKLKVYKDYEKKIILKHNADSVKSLNIDVDYAKTTFKYVLAPIYLANYVYRGKEYRLIVNGSNGRTFGKFPLSPTKVSISAILLLGVAALAIWFIFFR